MKSLIPNIFLSCDSTIVASLSSKEGRGSEETLIPQGDLDIHVSLLDSEIPTLEEENWSSVENSPHPGLSRTSSLRDRTGQSYKRIVTFNPTITRQSSLPNGGTATSSIISDDVDIQKIDSWGSHMDVQGESIQLRRKPIQKYTYFP